MNDSAEPLAPLYFRAEMKKLTANSIHEFIKHIHDISKEEKVLWFRGQPNADYQLSPNLYRNKTALPPEDELLSSYSKVVSYKVPSFYRALEKFKFKARPFLNKKPKNDFEWMFVMQHYGAPTRLIDWSTNALVALYFALQNEGEYKEPSDDGKEDYLYQFNETGYSEGGSAVYIINPLKINDISQGLKEIIDISNNSSEWKDFLDLGATTRAYFPICISAPHIDDRIRSQSGMFTLHGHRIEPLDWYEALKETMYKIYLPKEFWKTFKKDMKMLGITTSFIFPDLEGVAKEVKEEVLEHYREEI